MSALARPSVFAAVLTAAALALHPSIGAARWREAQPALLAALALLAVLALAARAAGARERRLAAIAAAAGAAVLVGALGFDGLRGHHGTLTLAPGQSLGNFGEEDGSGRSLGLRPLGFAVGAERVSEDGVALVFSGSGEAAGLTTARSVAHRGYRFARPRVAASGGAARLRIAACGRRGNARRGSGPGAPRPGLRPHDRPRGVLPRLRARRAAAAVLALGGATQPGRAPHDREGREDPPRLRPPVDAGRPPGRGPGPRLLPAGGRRGARRRDRGAPGARRSFRARRRARAGRRPRVLVVLAGGLGERPRRRRPAPRGRVDPPGRPRPGRPGRRAGLDVRRDGGDRPRRARRRGRPSRQRGRRGARRQPAADGAVPGGRTRGRAPRGTRRPGPGRPAHGGRPGPGRPSGGASRGRPGPCVAPGVPRPGGRRGARRRGAPVDPAGSPALAPRAWEPSRCRWPSLPPSRWRSPSESPPRSGTAPTRPRPSRRRSRPRSLGFRRSKRRPLPVGAASPSSSRSSPRHFASLFPFPS